MAALGLALLSIRSMRRQGHPRRAAMAVFNLCAFFPFVLLLYRFHSPRSLGILLLLLLAANLLYYLLRVRPRP